MAKSMSVKEIFAEEEQKGIKVFFGGRELVDFEDLSRDERKAVLTCFRRGLNMIEMISPKIAAIIRPQESLAVKYAAIAKGLFPETKTLAFPSEPGTIGVNWLIPQAIKYVATPSSSNPAYTSYGTNSWDMSLTAGTAAYIFGDGTHYYKASAQSSKHELILVFQHGLVEIGSTPKTDQFLLKTEIEQKYGIYTTHPLIELQVENNKTAYVYPTPGAIPVYHDLGIMWGFMPRQSGTSTLKLLGLFFYEHDFMSTLTYVS